MASGKKICKVCGKEYEYCKTWMNQTKFRWQDVACSPECGAKYFALIEASRTGKSVDAEPKKEVEIEVTQVIKEDDADVIDEIQDLKPAQRRKQRSKKDEYIDQ